MKLRQGITLAFALMATFGLFAMTVSVAHAADKGGPNFLEMPQSTSDNPWSGCWIGAGAGIANGVLSGAGPVGLSADGQKAAGLGGCRLQAGMFVGGGEIAYAHMFGDLSTIGIDNEMSVTGTLGVLIQPRALVYAHVSWARLDTAGGDIDGWKIGPGVALQVPNSALEVDFRYGYGTWNVSGLPPSVDVNSHEFMTIFKYRFNAK